MGRILIGADVGGTKTAVAVADGEAILARAEGRGAAVRAGRAILSASLIADTARRALAEARRTAADVVVVGAAGAGRAAEREELRLALRSEGFAERVTVTSDMEIALVAAFGDGPGIVLASGTGSIAVARDRGGRVHRAGGLGWQMGDEGSGYAIGRAALAAVGRAGDGRGTATALTPRVLTLLHLPDLDSLVRWAATASPAEVAALAPQVLAAAAAGDEVAGGIVRAAADELALLAETVLRHLPGDEPVGVAPVGGVLVRDRVLLDRVAARLEGRLRLLGEPVDPVLGALRMARQAE